MNPEEGNFFGVPFCLGWAKGGRADLPGLTLGGIPNPMSIATSITATVKNGEIVLPPGVDLPDGTVVRIELVKEQKATIWDVLKKYDGIATDLPSDLAANVDHYVHGHPKK
jgi:hypothetical protein